MWDLIHQNYGKVVIKNSFLAVTTWTYLLSFPTSTRLWSKRVKRIKLRNWKNIACAYALRMMRIFFFLREFQPMTFAPNDSSLSLDQDINQFFDVGGDWTPDLLCSTHKGRKSKPTYQNITEGSHNLESKKERNDRRRRNK